MFLKVVDIQQSAVNYVFDWAKVMGVGLVVADMKLIIVHCAFPIKKALGKTLILAEVGRLVDTSRVLSKACPKLRCQAH